MAFFRSSLQSMRKLTIDDWSILSAVAGSFGGGMLGTTVAYQETRTDFKDDYLKHFVVVGPMYTAFGSVFGLIAGYIVPLVVPVFATGFTLNYLHDVTVRKWKDNKRSKEFP